MPNPTKPIGNTPYRYLILGAGRQGVAAAFDLARFGEADSIHLVDTGLQFSRKVHETIELIEATSIPGFDVDGAEMHKQQR